MRLISLRLAAVAAAASLLAVAPAHADITVLDGVKVARQVRTFVDGTVHTYAEAQVDCANARIDPATKQLQQQLVTFVGSPFQAGGTIGNTSFGIAGQLPAFATTPTVNLGTLGGAATA